ncbi:Ig-like domain-containing protein [Micromonospora sp. NPDC049679]|uniref:Ig-like domain-containing protein n=1 Tax=Micromonospora sp. NPDC049679 TaxID=3155920 RepID=UPI0033C473C7
MATTTGRGTRGGRRVRAVVAAAVVAGFIGGTAPASADEIDVEAPTVSIVGLREGLRVRGTVTVTATALDNVGVTRIDVYANGVLTGSLSAARGTFAVDTAGRNGRFPIKVQAFDAAGNSAAATVTVTADNAGPVVDFVAPDSWASLTGFVTSRLNLSDPAGIAKADLYVAGTLEARRTSWPWSAVISMAGRSGRVHLLWRVTDKMGNQTVVTRNVVADNSAPKVRVTKGPRNKAQVRGTIRIDAAASDNVGVRFVELLVNRKVVARDWKAPHRFSVNTKKYNGRFTWRVRTVDRAGHVTVGPEYTAYAAKWPKRR